MVIVYIWRMGENRKAVKAPYVHIKNYTCNSAHGMVKLSRNLLFPSA